jgi:hypothetical protein
LTIIALVGEANTAVGGGKRKDFDVLDGASRDERRFQRSDLLVVHAHAAAQPRV